MRSVTRHAGGGGLRSKSASVLAVGLVALAGCSPGETASTGTSLAPPSVANSEFPAPSSTNSESVAPGTSEPGVDASCRAEASGPTTFVYAERPDTDPDLTSVDVYLPEGCGAVPVVMWVHGGGWRRGDKRNDPVEQKAAWAASLGAALVSVNYRLSTPESGVRWPDHGDDVAAAVAWVQREGPALGLQGDDITLLGHSAGAHLVAIVGADPALLPAADADPAAVSCIVALDFSFDLARVPAADLIANAFGTDPDVVAAASPNIQIERNGPPAARFLIATRGAPGRVADAQAFVDVVNDAGGTARLVDANPYSHNEINTRLGAPDDRLVTPPVSEFVASCASAGDVDRPDG